MSPHKIEVLPSAAALPSYGISKNGFLPASAPLTCLPNDYYQPWEAIIEVLPTLIETRQIRQRVDELSVLDTIHLQTEAEWQRAYSMLAVIAQGYIWQGPEPSDVSRQRSFQQGHPLLIKFPALAPCHLRPFPEGS
jgi:indoleamine 2,3-dioxygenase